MPSYTTSVSIAAPLEVVYGTLTDVRTWPQWSPTMDAVECRDPGPIRPGTTALVRQPGLRPATWEVDVVEPNRRFLWHTGGLGYRIEADHELVPHPDGTVARLSVAVSGPLSRLVWLGFGRKIRRYVDMEAAALKRRTEKDQPPG
jgi:uncharacterized membrane protein